MGIFLRLVVRTVSVQLYDDRINVGESGLTWGRKAEVEEKRQHTLRDGERCCSTYRLPSVFPYTEISAHLRAVRQLNQERYLVDCRWILGSPSIPPVTSSSLSPGPKNGTTVSPGPKKPTRRSCNEVMRMSTAS